MQVNVSLSKQNFTEKPTPREWATMAYQYKQLDLYEFWNAILSGFCYTAIFNRTDFTTKQKTKENFKGTQVISIDVDNALTTTTLKDFISECQTKPTLSYITPSHLKEDEKGEVHARFRLVYICDAIITDADTYKALYEQIYSGIPQRFLDNSKKADNCGASPYQQFGGNAKAYTWRNNAIYEGYIFEIAALKDQYNGIVSLNDFALQEPSKAPNKPKAQASHKEVETEFMADLNTLSPNELIKKYASEYKHITATNIDFKGQLYAQTPKDYIEITNKFEVTETEEGKIKVRAHIYKDREQRRKTMYIHSVLRRQIKPNISKEELIYNLIFDRAYLYDNADGQLNISTLIKIAENALKATYTITQKKQKKFKINKEECQRQGISTKVMVRKAAKEINYTHIGELYDTSKGVTENLKELNAQGVKVCRRTLYNFCNANGIPTKGTEWKPKRRTAKKIITRKKITKTTMQKEEKKYVTEKDVNILEFTTLNKWVMNARQWQDVITPYTAEYTKQIREREKIYYETPLMQKWSTLKQKLIAKYCSVAAA